MAAQMYITALDAPEAADERTGLALVGGKGMNLARMARAGLPVPGGFMLTTLAYRAFVKANELQGLITAALPEGLDQNPARLDAASTRIREAFRACQMPEEIAQQLRQAYQGIDKANPAAVAVRSSATAEDLPDLSFAGQQDTFLNVRGEEALLQEVIDCRSSLWTASAIGYRARNHVAQFDAALAVVVQNMVEAQVAGVLFTANPLSGARGETVINAAYGLGEALVSGKVEPDQYIVDTASGKILSKNLGAKSLSMHGQAGGGLTEVETDRGGQQALPDEQIIELTHLAQRVEKLYETPQDIEWAWADGQFSLLQSRPVTSLFPIPEGMAADPLQVMFSFAAVQGMMAPITPLGRDVLRALFATAAGLYGYRYTAETQRVLYPAGERLWVNITQVLRNSLGKKITTAALGMMEPSAQQALSTVIDEPSLKPGRSGIRPRTVLRLMKFFLPTIANFARNMAAPARRRKEIFSFGEQFVVQLRAQNGAIQGDAYQRLPQILVLFENTLRTQLPGLFIKLVSAVAAGMASLNLVSKLASRLPDQAAHDKPGGWTPLALEITRGLPNNPTTEMDLRLWEIARVIKSDSRLLAEFSGRSSEEIAQRYASGAVSYEARELIDGFLQQYGSRGLAEIDTGRPRWRENPQHIIEMLMGYLQINDLLQAPDMVFARGAQSAEAAVIHLAQGLLAQRGGWFKARLARFAARRVRLLLSFREYPKFIMVRVFDALRWALIKAGAELVERGDLERTDDLMYLSFAEIKAFASQEPRDWRSLIARRRESNQREEQRKQIPRLLLSDGRAFYDGLRAAGEDTQDGRMLSGSPVSPGSVQGRVRVVFDPRRADLLPGEVLVCPGTDPSWTPLFLTASALVMEVGGMMTHGAVVAREYGIPAIVGVHRATERLTTGQLVQVDGSSGMVEIIEE